MKKIIILILFAFTLIIPTTGYASPRRIATFNIQNLGHSKMSDPAIVASIVNIIRTYDIVAVQEISDISGNTPIQLLDAINTVRNDYGMSLSPRSGQQPDDHTRAEQYAFYYRKDIYELIGNQLYNDFQFDYFSREPWIARFRHIESAHTFVMITIHTVPTETVDEINALHPVVQSLHVLWPEEQNVIILGDMNADCNYASEAQINGTAMSNPNYFWVVPNSADTNVSEHSECAYDRIILTQYFSSRYTGQWGIDHRTGKSVSDHWAVWFELDF